jgi:hypothetical protein
MAAGEERRRELEHRERNHEVEELALTVYHETQLRLIEQMTDGRAVNFLARFSVPPASTAGGAKVRPEPGRRHPAPAVAARPDNRHRAAPVAMACAGFRSALAIKEEDVRARRE